MRQIRIDTIDQRLLSGNTDRPLKSGEAYREYSAVPFKWSDPSELKMTVWFNKNIRVMKVRPDIGHTYLFTPDTVVTTTTTTSTTNSTTTTSSSSTISTTTTTL